MTEGITEQYQLNVLPRSQHSISRRNISESALKVLYRLNKAGFRACLVGGGVRDVLLGKQPKDFDVATDATPEQIRGLFKNSRLIGRRFRLAHIRYGREVIEVATFRQHAPDSEKTTLNDEGRILRDNTFGDIADDALRRDFTVNALYYDINDFSVLDYARGMTDLQNATLKGTRLNLTQFGRLLIFSKSKKNNWFKYLFRIILFDLENI